MLIIRTTMLLPIAEKNFATYLENSGKSPLTIKNYKYDVKQFIKSFSGLDEIEKFTLDDIGAFLKQWKKSGKSAATQNRMKSSLSRFFGYLFEAGHIQKLPFRSL